jgi:hypothetical protein
VQNGMIGIAKKLGGALGAFDALPAAPRRRRRN